MATQRLGLTRPQILAHRRSASALDARLPTGPGSLLAATRAGAQDSMPRAALLSLHARVADVGADILDDPSLVQVWGPRYSTYVISLEDLAVFTLGRLPDDPRGMARAEEMAERLATAVGPDPVPESETGQALGIHPQSLRYAAPTGRVIIRWDGARQPLVRMVPPPEVDPSDARLELARRHFHILGPSTPASFGRWAGIKEGRAVATFEALGAELVVVDTPIGEGWILAADESSFRGAGTTPATRLLPSGDTYYLLWGADREILVPDGARRALLWTSRVWPGAVLVDGEVVGTWRRAGAVVTLQPWRPLSPSERADVEGEATSLPLPGLERPITVRWDDGDIG